MGITLWWDLGIWWIICARWESIEEIETVFGETVLFFMQNTSRELRITSWFHPKVSEFSVWYWRVIQHSIKYKILAALIRLFNLCTVKRIRRECWILLNRFVLQKIENELLPIYIFISGYCVFFWRSIEYPVKYSDFFIFVILIGVLYNNLEVYRFVWIFFDESIVLEED